MVRKNQFPARAAGTLAGGKFATGGNTASLNALVLTANSTIDLGGACILAFANSNPTLNSYLTAWTGTLSITNWTLGSSHLIVGSDNTGLSSAQLGQIKFGDFAKGAQISAVSNSMVSVGEITPLIGDINQDGKTNLADIQALATALVDMHAYATSHGFTASDVSFILDVNQDGSANNADLQGELALLTHPGTGSSSAAPVPEPSSGMLAVAALVGIALCWQAGDRRVGRSHSGAPACT